MTKENILIIGKSLTAIRHFKILKSIYPNKKIIFMGRNYKFYNFKNRSFFEENNFVLPNFFFFVIICTPSDSHIKYSKKFLEKTRYLLIEKPLCNNFLAAKNFYNYVKKINSKTHIQVGYNLRYLKSLIKFKYLVSKQKLGNIYYVKCSIGKSIEYWREGALNFAVTKKNGGGALLELSHEIDYLIWIFGNLKVVNSHINKKRKFKFKVDQSIFAILKCENQNFKNIPINLTIDILNNTPHRYCEVICEKGNIILDIENNKIKYAKNKIIKDISFKKNTIKNTYYDQIISFVKLKKNHSLLNIKKSLNILKIISKIKNEN